MVTTLILYKINYKLFRMTLILTSFMLEYIHRKLVNVTNTMEVSEIIAELFQNNWDKNLSYLLFYLLCP